MKAPRLPTDPAGICDQGIGAGPAQTALPESIGFFKTAVTEPS